MTSRFHFIPNFEIRSVALLAALTVGSALAAQDIDAAFTRADANKDGKLSRQEAARFPAVEQRFDQIDTNKDQFVSREEFEIAMKS